MGISEQLNEIMVKENLWYIHQENVHSFSPVVEEKKSKKPDSERKKVVDRIEPSIPKSIGRNRSKRECTFVVDWQLSDSL